MQRINIPGVGIVQFPDSMSDEQIDQAIQRDILPGIRGATQVAPTMPTGPAPAPQQPGRLESTVEAARSIARPLGSIIEQAGDIGGSVISGAGSVAAGLGGLGGMAGLGYDNLLARIGRGVSEFGESVMSPELREKRQALTQAIRDAESQGFMAEAGAALRTLASNPSLLFSMTLEQIPAFVLSGGVGRAATLTGQVAARAGARGAATGAERLAAERTAREIGERAGTAGTVGTFAGIQAGGVSGETYQEVMGLPAATIERSPVYQELLQSMSPEEARQTVAERAAREAGVLSGGISVATMTLMPSAERSLFTQGVSRSAIRRALGLGAAEAGSEAIEEGGGQFAQNLAIQRRADLERSLMQGVGGAAATGAALGGTTGAAVGALQRPPMQDGVERPDVRSAIEQIVRERGVETPPGVIVPPGAEVPAEAAAPVAEVPAAVPAAAPAVVRQPDLFTQPGAVAGPEVPASAVAVPPAVAGVQPELPAQPTVPVEPAPAAVEVPPERAAPAPAEIAAAPVPPAADDLYARAVEVVREENKGSTSLIQRKLGIGYNAAAKLIERMENDGIISAADNVGRRTVLTPAPAEAAPAEAAPQPRPDWRLGEPVEAAPEVPDVLPQNVKEIVDYMRKGRRTEPKGQVSLVQAIIKAGGLKDTGGEIKQVLGGTVKTRPGLINRKAGIQLDEAAEYLAGRGYFVDMPTDNEIIAAIEDELAGRAVNYGKTEDVRGQQIAEAARELQREMDIAGVSPQNTDAEIARALGIETPTQPRTFEDIEREDAARSAFSARSTEARAESPAAAAKVERSQQRARATVNKFLDDLRSRGRQARIFAGDLDRLLRDRTMTAEQIYRGFMVADTLAKTVPARADYRLKFVQDLVVDNEDAGRASGAEMGQRAQGRVVYPEEGSAGLIELSLAKDMLPYLNETAAHEGFHILQTYFAEYDKAFADRISKFFKEDMKITDLEPSIKRRLQALKPPGSKVSYYDLLVQGLGDKPLSVKEAQAYAFGSLVDASMRGKPTAGILPPFQRFVLFAKEFLAKLKSALNKDGFESAADLLLSAQRRGARMTQAAPTAEGAAYSGRTLPPTIEVDGVTRPTTNSEGRQIHPTAEGVRNFWRWFGDSKVVDAEGRPQVVYHGTSKDKDFASFNVPKRGAWFAADPAEASSYANENDSRAVKYDWNTRQFRDVNTAARVIPVYLSIKNPVDLTQGQKDRLSGKTGEENYARVQGDVFSELRAAGADGVQAAPGVWVALKDPTQVKSAIGNLGTFKPTDKRTQYSARRVTDKDPVLEEAAKGVRAGAVTREEYEALVNERKPVNPYAYVPEPATEAEITSALERTDPRKVPLVGKASERLKEGDEVGLRLDIPAYSKQNTWVVSVHEPKGQGFYAGTPIGYESTAVATDVKLGVVEGGAMKIAAGDIDKTTIAVMRGKWKPATSEQAKARADAAMNDPNWIQVGMDPRRHQYFYDRNSMEPVVAADEVIQVGPLVLAKNPTYANKAAYQYSARRVPDQYAARATGQVAGLPAFGQRVNPQTPSGTQQAELNVQYDVVSRALGKRFGRFISPAKFESFFMKFQDKMLPVGRMIDDIRAAGGNVAVAMDAYLKEDLMQGKVAALLEWRKKNLYDPLVNAIADSGLSIQDFENFLYARHAPERNRYIASINPDMPDGGSGLTNKQAEEMMKEFQQQGKTAKLTELAKMFDKIIEDTNRVRVEAGLTPDFSQMTMTEDGRLLPNWEFYAPLRNFVQESVDGSETVKEFRPKTGKALGARGREDRRVTGRERLAGDILAHAMMQNTQAVIRGEQNKVGQSFLALIRANPEQTKDLAQVIASAPLRTTIVDGIVKTMPDPFYKNDPDVLVVKENGKEVAIRIFDDNVARAMTGASALSPTSQNILVQGMAAVNRFLAKVNTAYNPEFLITNFARDLQTFGINVEQFDIDGLTRDVMGDLKGSLSGIRDVTRGTNNNPEMARYFERFRELGGTTDMYGFADIETRIAEINETMNKIGTDAKSWKEMAQKATGPVIKFLEDYNTVVENGIRTALFKNLVERGFNEEKAAQAAKNITVNFSKGGEQRVLMNALYLFYNASLQGSMAMMNAIGRSPKVRKIVAGVVVAGVLQDVINSMLSDVDDDEEKVYDKIPDHVLKRSFVLMDPFQITDRGYFSFPMPYGFNAFFNMGREMSKVTRGATSPMKAAGSIVGTFVDSFNPIGGSESILNFIAPTILDPVVDIVENRDFAGRPIVPERGGFGPQVPESQKYWNNTFAPYVSISNFLNEVTGGTRVIPGAVDISPNIIQYAVNYATGGVGKFVERTFNTVTGTIPDALRGDLQEVDVKGVPLLRSLYGNVTTRSDTERYMERMEEVLRVRQEIRDAGQYGQTERIDAAMRRYPGQVEIMEAFSRISRERAQLSQQINAINRNPNIDADSKKEIIKLLRDQQNALVGVANQLYNQSVERRQ